MARFTLISSDFGLGYELFPASRRLAARYARDSGHESVLIASDWDFPGLARDLGWNGKLGRGDHCSHRGTDGTVSCPDCGRGASAFISAAREYLDSRCGQSFNDPHGSLAAYFGW